MPNSRDRELTPEESAALRAYLNRYDRTLRPMITRVRTYHALAGILLLVAASLDCSAPWVAALDPWFIVTPMALVALGFVALAAHCERRLFGMLDESATRGRAILFGVAGEG